VVAWDRRTGNPLHRAIVWQDRRTAERCDALRAEGVEPFVRATTGLVLDPYFSATKAEWLLTEGGVPVTPDLAIGTIDAWVLGNLTGGPHGGVLATEPSNASRTMLFDIRSLAWSDELLDRFGVPASALPEVRPSSGRFGTTAAGTGVAPGIPVSGIAGDQQAALFGQACLEAGMTKNTYGTGSFVLMHVGDTCPQPVEGLLTTVAWTLADGTRAYALEGAIFVTGAAVQWLRDGLGIIERADEIAALAASVPDTDGCYLVPAFTGLGSPWWDPYARGTIVGITRGTGRGHLARAVLESISLQTRDVVTAMSEASGHPIRGLKADGGAAANDLLLQLQADDLQVPVSRPVIQETTALGAAYLAGLAEGVWDSPADITANWQLDATFDPATEPDAAAARHAAWARAVERSRGWAHDG
jgi:glycerol kinase